MNTRDLKSLNESIESVMTHEEARDIVHNFIHSLSEMASQLDEGTSAKRMRIIRKHLVSGKPITGKVADFMQRSFKKKTYKNKEKFGGETPAVLGRARLKQAAMKAKGLAEAEQLDEAGYKKLMRLKGKAYATKDPKIARAAAEQEAKYAASKARRGGASAEAVKGGGSMLGKKGKYTQKARNLALKRAQGLRNFETLVKDRGVARDTGIGSVEAMGMRVRREPVNMSRKDVAKKRESQAARRKFDRMVHKVGTFRKPEDPVAAAREKRPVYNFLKRTGRL